MCVVELGFGARLLCVFVVFFTVLCSFADVAGVMASCVLRLIEVVDGCRRRRLHAGFTECSYWACDAAGLSVMLGLCIIVVGFLTYIVR